MAPDIEHALESWCAGSGRYIGEIFIERLAEGEFVVCHRDDVDCDGLGVSIDAENAVEIAKFGDAGKYRPLKTAPNLRHGWRLELKDARALRRALDLLYPGRLAMFFIFEKGKLHTTPLRETLERQTGMYRVAARISDDQIDELVGNFCRSDGGCLRTILWKRDAQGAVASLKLPPEKFDPAFDQTGGGESCIPLLCQEACNLLVNAAREVVKHEQ